MKASIQPRTLDGGPHDLGALRAGQTLENELKGSPIVPVSTAVIVGDEGHRLAGLHGDLSIFSHDVTE